MQGGAAGGAGGRGRGRGEQGQGDAPGPGAWDIVAGVAVAGAAGLAAYKLYGALTSKPDEEDDQRDERMTRPMSYNWLTGWFNREDFKRSLASFWHVVRQTEVEEREAIEKEVCGFQLESAIYQHKYNKFDTWFQNLLKNILKIDNNERRMFVEAFDEILEVVLEEMGDVDPLFKYMYRTFGPAGSSWEDLRICNPDEFDVNIILLPIDIQGNVRVEDVGKGHIAIRLDNGFEVSERTVSKKLKLNNDPRFKQQYESIKAQLSNWMENGYVSRLKVMYWMQSVVDKAVRNLVSKAHQWNHIQRISRSVSGPAVTINAVMRNGKSFSIDLVPAFEFSQEHLPHNTQTKIISKRINRSWYGIPKGPSRESSPKMWRTSLYQAERDFMRGNYHLKPSIRIMKRLRDMQEWKVLSSYYIKTKFMWMMDEKNYWGRSLGQIVMLALNDLQSALRKAEIKYYWDEDLNLLDNGSNKEFFQNVSGYLSRIIRDFDRSVDDNNIDPMRYFGCDKNGNPLGSRPSLSLESLSINSPTRSNEECVVM